MASFKKCSQNPVEFDYFPAFLNKDSTRQAIHVGNMPFHSGSSDVEKALLNVMTVPKKTFRYLCLLGCHGQHGWKLHCLSWELQSKTSLPQIYRLYMQLYIGTCIQWSSRSNCGGTTHWELHATAEMVQARRLFEGREESVEAEQWSGWLLSTNWQHLPASRGAQCWTHTAVWPTRKGKDHDRELCWTFLKLCTI